MAGPNGSGKSTLKKIVGQNRLRIFLNAEEVEQALAESGRIDLSAWSVHGSGAEFVSELKAGPRLAGMDPLAWSLIDAHHSEIIVQSGAMKFSPYLAASIVDLMRSRLLESRASFAFETVMSHPSKIQFMSQARALGYRTYLYFVATRSPEINLARVAARVKRGGHDVPEEKVRDRYERSLQLLSSAIQSADRAYIFDNSSDGKGPSWIAEFQSDGPYEYRSELMPDWFMTYVDAKML